MAYNADWFAEGTTYSLLWIRLSTIYRQHRVVFRYLYLVFKLYRY